MSFLHRTAAALATLCVATLACAAEPAAQNDNAGEGGLGPVSNLRLSGFGTVGAVHTNGTQPFVFRREISQPINEGNTRYDVDSRLGLQANYTVNEQVELVGQLLLKRRVAESPPADSVEWLFAAYRPAPDLTLRFGRMAPDTFVLADYRSVGFAYPWVRPNVDTYGGLPVFSIEGLDITRTWDLGDVRWRGRLFGGQGHTRVLPLRDDAPNTNVRFRSLLSASLSRESGGLQVRATFARFKLDLGDQPWKGALRAGLSQVAGLPIPAIAAEARQLADGIDPDSSLATYFVLGASYDSGVWIAGAEAVRLRSNMTYALNDSGYVSVGRRFGAVTAFGMLGAARTPREKPAYPQWDAQLAPLVGPAAAAAAQTAGNIAADSVGASRIDQRSISAGLRWDFHPQAALKLQWDHFSVRHDGSVLWGGNRTPAPQSANVVTTTLDFVF